VPGGDLVSHEHNIQSLRVPVNKQCAVERLAHPLRVPVLVFLGIALLGDRVGGNLVASEAVGADTGLVHQRLLAECASDAGATKVGLRISSPPQPGDKQLQRILSHPD
jgi:hypothetical protein